VYNIEKKKGKGEYACFCLCSAFVEHMLAPVPGMKVVDVAGGTGDIAFRILDRIRGMKYVLVSFRYV
jgi:ubiE/COQ5 methyltransferase-like protein